MFPPPPDILLLTTPRTGHHVPSALPTQYGFAATRPSSNSQYVWTMGGRAMPFGSSPQFVEIGRWRPNHTGICLNPVNTPSMAEAGRKVEGIPAWGLPCSRLARVLLLAAEGEDMAPNRPAFVGRSATRARRLLRRRFRQSRPFVGRAFGVSAPSRAVISSGTICSFHGPMPSAHRF